MEEQFPFSESLGLPIRLVEIQPIMHGTNEQTRRFMQAILVEDLEPLLRASAVVGVQREGWIVYMTNDGVLPHDAETTAILLNEKVIVRESDERQMIRALLDNIDQLEMGVDSDECEKLYASARKLLEKK